MTSGWLQWSVKQGFVEYVESLPDGEVEADGLDAPFRFPLTDAGDFDPASSSGRLRFGGRLGFRGHGALLAVDVADPWIELGERSLLSVADRHEASGRLPLVELPAPIAGREGGQLRWRVEAPRLTFEGTYEFGSIYAAGTTFAPLEAVLSLSGSGETIEE